MNIEELEANIEQLKEQIGALQEAIEKLKKKENKRWRADRTVNATYYALTNELDVYATTDNNEQKDKKRHKYHNYFKTNAEAQAVADNIKTHIELMELAEELNTEPVNWTNARASHYYIYYNHDEETVGLGNAFYSKHANTVYCTNKIFRDEAIKRIGEERLIKYLKGE